MNLFTYKNGDLRDWVLNLIAGILVAGLFIGLLVAVVGFANHTAHVSCLRLHEVTQLETRYERSGFNGECYVNINGRWVPEKRWREFDDE